MPLPCVLLSSWLRQCLCRACSPVVVAKGVPFLAGLRPGRQGVRDAQRGRGRRGEASWGAEGQGQDPVQRHDVVRFFTRPTAFRCGPSFRLSETGRVWSGLSAPIRNEIQAGAAQKDLLVESSAQSKVLLGQQVAETSEDKGKGERKRRQPDGSRRPQAIRWSQIGGWSNQMKSQRPAIRHESCSSGRSSSRVADS